MAQENYIHDIHISTNILMNKLPAAVAGQHIRATKRKGAASYKYMGRETAIALGQRCSNKIAPGPSSRSEQT